MRRLDTGILCDLASLPSSNQVISVPHCVHEAPTRSGFTIPTVHQRNRLVRLGVGAYGVRWT